MLPIMSSSSPERIQTLITRGFPSKEDWITGKILKLAREYRELLELALDMGYVERGAKARANTELLQQCEGFAKLLELEIGNQLAENARAISEGR